MKVADLTTDELKGLVSEAVEEKLRELFLDADSGLQVREEVEERLAASLSSKERIALDEVKKRLGLD